MGRGIALVGVCGPRPALIRDFRLVVGSRDKFLEEWVFDMRDCSGADDLGGS